MLDNALLKSVDQKSHIGFRTFEKNIYLLILYFRPGGLSVDTPNYNTSRSINIIEDSVDLLFNDISYQLLESSHSGNL